TPAAFATTPISRGDFAIGLATRQAVAPKEKQCAPVRAKGRHGHTTSGLRRFRSYPEDGSRSSRRIKSSLRPADARARVRTRARLATNSGDCGGPSSSRRGMAARPARALKARSSLVRRLVRAQAAHTGVADDEQLASLGLPPEDLLVLHH